jgi:DNA mismatch endonuclease (patch repair protein)
MDKLSTEHRSWNMSRIQGKNTRPEIAMRALLHRNGFRFRLHEKKLLGKPDIILPKYKSVIFVHGCFWHRHENCKYCYIPKSRNEFWDSKFQRTVQRDIEHMKGLSEEGWLPIVAWECEIKENPTGILEKVQKILQGQLQKIKGGT